MLSSLISLQKMHLSTSLGRHDLPLVLRAVKVLAIRFTRVWCSTSPLHPNVLFGGVKSWRAQAPFFKKQK